MSDKTYLAVVCDPLGFVMDIPESIGHLRHHDRDDIACEACPSEAYVVTGSAMPSEPDEEGFNSRLPGTFASRDVLVEHTDLADDDLDDAIAKIEHTVLIANALNAYTP